MDQNDAQELPSLDEAIAVLSTLPDGDYSPSDLFALSPEYGRAGLKMAHANLTPPTRTVRFRGTSGEARISRPPRPNQLLISRSDPQIHIQAGEVWVTFDEQGAV